MEIRQIIDRALISGKVLIEGFQIVWLAPRNNLEEFIDSHLAVSALVLWSWRAVQTAASHREQGETAARNDDRGQRRCREFR